MRVTVETEILSALVANAGSILKKGRTIRLVAQDASDGAIGKISVVSFEDTTVSAWHGPAEISRAGSIAVRGDTLDRFLRLSSKSDKAITLETVDVNNRESLRIITARGAHEFDGYPEAVFDQIDPGQSQIAHGDLRDFAEALKIAKSSTPSEADVAGARIALSGVHVRPQGDEFHIVGTDGKRLALCALHTKSLQNSEIPPDGITIPGRMVATVCNIIGSEASAIRAVDNNLIVENSTGAMSFPLIDADYPNYLGLLSSQGEHKMEISSKMILTALDRSSAAIGQEDRFITATLLRDADGIHLSSFTSQESSSEMLAEEGGEECEISFNVSYMKRAISNMSSDKICIEFTAVTNPIVISSEDRPDLRMLVMPLKGSSGR